jgi:hypothetical protein
MMCATDQEHLTAKRQSGWYYVGVRVNGKQK